MKQIPETGFLRINQILQFIPIGKSSFYARVASGEYPKGVKIGKRTTAWRVDDIRDLIERMNSGQ